jgi:hypothetical protein
MAHDPSVASVQITSTFVPVSKAKRSRYTPPPPKKAPPSPLWVPVVMGTMMLTGLIVVLTNYLGLLPGDQQNGYLLLGLAWITGGFILATTYR